MRNKIEEVSDSNSTTGSPNVPNLPLTKQAEKALKTTFLEAKLYSTEVIGTPHLLLCILRNETDPMYNLLEQFGVNYDIVKELFEERVNDDSYHEIKSETPFDDSPQSSNPDDFKSQKKNKHVSKSKTPVLNNFPLSLDTTPDVSL